MTEVKSDRAQARSLDFISPNQTDPSKVRRSKDGRPYVKQACPNIECDNGRMPGVRAGFTKKCDVCKGQGFKEKLYTRCTSFVGVLDDRSNLEKWKLRIVLTGLGVDHDLLDALDEADPDDRKALDDIASRAFEVGEGHAKAQKGTDLHKLSEHVDWGTPLPEALYDPETDKWRPVTLQDRADMAAWQRAIQGLGGTIVDTERFVVHDHYQIGGTYDRLFKFKVPRCTLCGKPNILDLKTGRVDYGAGKIAQQLAVYANSDDYDPETGQREPQDVCTHLGIVVHLPQGTGEAEILYADLVKGWEAVALSSQVREYRRQEKGFLDELR